MTANCQSSWKYKLTKHAAKAAMNNKMTIPSSIVSGICALPFYKTNTEKMVSCNWQITAKDICLISAGEPNSQNLGKGIKLFSKRGKGIHCIYTYVF